MGYLPSNARNTPPRSSAAAMAASDVNNGVKRDVTDPGRITLVPVAGVSLRPA